MSGSRRDKRAKARRKEPGAPAARGWRLGARALKMPLCTLLAMLVRKRIASVASSSFVASCPTCAAPGGGARRVKAGRQIAQTGRSKACACCPAPRLEQEVPDGGGEALDVRHDVLLGDAEEQVDVLADARLHLRQAVAFCTRGAREEAGAVVWGPLRRLGGTLPGRA